MKKAKAKATKKPAKVKRAKRTANAAKVARTTSAIDPVLQKLAKRWGLDIRQMKKIVAEVLNGEKK